MDACRPASSFAPSRLRYNYYELMSVITKGYRAFLLQSDPDSHAFTVCSFEVTIVAAIIDLQTNLSFAIGSSNQGSGIVCWWD